MSKFILSNSTIHQSESLIIGDNEILSKKSNLKKIFEGYFLNVKDIKNIELASINSSHDEEWEVNLFAAQFGIKYIERHLCESKLDVGLDISTSSDPSEFKRLNHLLSNYNSILQSSKRTPNQGEVLNVRNLGTSLYSKKDIPIGEKLSIEDFEEKSPRVGISQEEFELLEDKILKHPLRKGEALIDSHFKLVDSTIAKELSDFSNQSQLSLPVRLHDFDFFNSS